jgi:hypothetical protein
MLPMEAERRLRIIAVFFGNLHSKPKAYLYLPTWRVGPEPQWQVENKLLASGNMMILPAAGSVYVPGPRTFLSSHEAGCEHSVSFIWARWSGGGCARQRGMAHHRKPIE